MQRRMSFESLEGRKLMTADMGLGVPVERLNGADVGADELNVVANHPVAESVLPSNGDGFGTAVVPPENISVYVSGDTLSVHGDGSNNFVHVDQSPGGSILRVHEFFNGGYQNRVHGRAGHDQQRECVWLWWK